MNESVNENQQPLVRQPYEYAITLLVVHETDALESRDEIGSIWDFESVGEAMHLTLTEASETDAPLPDQIESFPVILVYDHDLEGQFEDPLFVSSNLEEVSRFIQNFESEYKVTNTEA